MVGSHLLKCWSSTQAGVAMSSGEAEFYSAVKGAATGLGMKALYRDIGYKLPLRLWTDSSAAVGICSRQGLGGTWNVPRYGFSNGSDWASWR